MSNLEQAIREQSRLMWADAMTSRLQMATAANAEETSFIEGYVEGVEQCAKQLDQFCDELFDRAR